ncbi:MAG: hypothetical protein MJZ04_11070 [Bacteroidales bacterium]|nr:hypothetical protein [Bacteroidales bacterium]
MKEKTSALYSEYIIDGVPQDLTPAAMLDDSLSGAESAGAGEKYAPVVDETLDPKIACESYDSWKIQDYLQSVSSFGERTFPVVYSAQYTRVLIARALLDALWLDGHFRLGDLKVKTLWRWDTLPIGNMAAFYASAQAAGEYSDSLGTGIDSYVFEEAQGCSFEANAVLASSSVEDDDLLTAMPFRTENAVMDTVRRHPSTFVDDPDSWIAYVPLETCKFRLGGSTLSQATRNDGGAAPELEDPDYFMDSYEVLREMVEDDIIIAGDTVADGGIMAALRRMSGGRTGVRVNARELMSAYQESDMVRMLFAEVPGVVIQIRDNDFDYVDAEFTLQDVTFFPLGHPTPGKRDIRVESSDKSGIQTILESLIRSQSSEGED